MQASTPRPSPLRRLLIIVAVVLVGLVLAGTVVIGATLWMMRGCGCVQPSPSITAPPSALVAPSVAHQG